MMARYRYVILAVAIAVIAVIVYLCLPAPKETIEVSPGKIKDVEAMARLCTVDLYSEVPVKDTINNKMLFGIQKQKGSVSFDMDNLRVDSEGDTVKIELSPEIVEIHEATEDNSWQVIDTKGLSVFTSDKLTDEEENQIKSRIKGKAIRMLYQNGTIERARAEGVRNLQSLMEKVYNKPVKVTDPTPKGAHYNDYR